MKFWDYFIYHTIRDVQNERGKQKEKKRQFNTDRMQTAGVAMGDFGQAVLDIASRAYQSDNGPRELTDGIVPALMFAVATICRVDGGMTAEQEKVVQIVINNFPGKVSMAGLKSTINSSAPLAQSYPAGYLSEGGCGSFWRALYRCCKKFPAPSAELQTALTHFSDFLANFSFAGRTDTRAEVACNALLTYANQHLNDPENDAAPDLDLFGDGKPEEHMAKFQKIYLHVVSKSNAYAEMSGIDQLLPLFKAKTIADLVMMGDIPANAKIAEVEFYFAQFGVELDVDAKHFLLSISSQDEFGRGVSQIMDTHDTEPPQFWQICRIMCIKAGEDTQLIELTKAYYGFTISMAAQLRHKYPNGNYTQEKAKKYAMTLLDALATILK